MYTIRIQFHFPSYFITLIGTDFVTATVTVTLVDCNCNIFCDCYTDKYILIDCNCNSFCYFSVTDALLDGNCNRFCDCYCYSDSIQAITV